MISFPASAASEALDGIVALIPFLSPRSRRRARIEADLSLLAKLELHDDLNSGSWAHQCLVAQIEIEVCRMTGVEIGATRREVDWWGVAAGVVFTSGLSVWAYMLDRVDLSAWSAIPATAAFQFFISTCVLLANRVPNVPPGTDPRGNSFTAELPIQPVNPSIADAI